STAALPNRLIHFLFFYSSRAHRDLHSFPTRRSSDLGRGEHPLGPGGERGRHVQIGRRVAGALSGQGRSERERHRRLLSHRRAVGDRKSTRLNSSHLGISYAVFCLKKKKKQKTDEKYD